MDGGKDVEVTFENREEYVRRRTLQRSPLRCGAGPGDAVVRIFLGGGFLWSWLSWMAAAFMW